MTKINSKTENNPARTGSLQNKLLYLLPAYLVVFCAFFDTHAQMPILAPYALTLGAGPFTLGVIVGAYSLFNVAGNFVGGAMIDKKSWKQPLLFGLIGAAAALILYTLAGSAYQLAAVRSLHGLMGGILIPATLASLTVEEKSPGFYSPRLAFFGAAVGLAAISGPPGAGVAAVRFGFHAVYYGLACLMLAAAICASLMSVKTAPFKKPVKTPPPALNRILADHELRGALIFALAMMGATGALASFLPVRAQLLGFDHDRVGMLFATFALTAVLVQLIWPRLIKPLLQENCRGCRVGIALICLALVLAASLNSTAGLFFALTLYGIGFGAAFQGMLGLVLSGSEVNWRGRAIGLFFAAYSIGAALMPPVSGLIWEHLPRLFPFYTAAAIAGLSLFYKTNAGRQSTDS